MADQESAELARDAKIMAVSQIKSAACQCPVQMLLRPIKLARLHSGKSAAESNSVRQPQGITVDRWDADRPSQNSR